VGIAFLTGWIGLYAQQLTGTHDITGTSAFNESGGQFATIKEAFDSLRARGVGAGGVTFRVQNSWVGSATGQDAEPNTIELTTYPGAGPGNPVTLTFDQLTSAVYFAKAPDPTAGNRFIFRFTGSVKYFTLDGAGKLILKSTTSTTGGSNPSGTNTGLIGFVSVSTSSSSLDLDIDAITIKNVVMHGSGRGTTFSGVYIGQDASLTAGTVSTGSNIGAAVGITIQGCTIDSVSRPILVAGRPANTQKIGVLNNELGHPTDTAGWCAASGIGAIHIRGTVGVTVRGNIVHPQRSTNHSVAGIRLDSCEAATIERNWIKGVVYLGTIGYGAYGIALNLPASYISPDPQTTVLNNMIAGIYADGDRSSLNGTWVISGIWVTAPSAVTSAQVRLIHNSINLFDDPVLSANRLTSVVGASSGITLGSNIRGGVVIDGNLIQNRLSPRQRRDGNQAAYGILIYNSSLASSTIDYQCYRINATPANNYIGCLGNPLTAANNHPTLSAWQTAISGEANGIDHAPVGDVPFLSDTNLHLNSSAPSLAINAGNPAYNNVALDFDGQTRPLPTNPPGSANTPPDPGTAPDIGADELDGTPFSCPSSLQAPDIVVTATYPPLAGTDYLWGQQVEIDTTGTNSPTPSGVLNLIYSLDGGVTWTAGPSVSSFPVTITLPPFTPPTYTGTLTIAVVATAPAFCSLTPDTSNNPVSINLTDRPGNRAANAILITLTPDPLNPGHWIAPLIADSTNGPGLSNEYVDPTPGPFGGGRGRPTRDLFFVIDLPECLDSLDVSLCSSTSGLLNDTYLHLINATVQDTIDSDDGCSPSGGSLRSEIRALGLPNVLGHNPTSNVNAKPARDTLLLVSGHTLYIVVEGYNSDGKFELQVKGYKMRPSSINVTGAPSGPVCVNSGPITLDATTPDATAYQWLDANGDPISGATNATYTISPDAEGTLTVTAKVIFNPNEDQDCDSDFLTESVTIIVEDTARAQIADANDNPVGQTLSITAGTSVTLKAFSQQTPDNSYIWNLYNDIPPSGTPTTSQGNTLTINNISAGSYTVILEAVRGFGACDTTRDTVYLNVTTGLRTDAGTFSIFPNPNTGAFTIVAPAMDTYRVQVLDVAGRLVVEDAFTGSTYQMRLSLPAGVYQIRLVAGDKAQIGRLIITE
jgi:hypothetical protein